MKLIEKTIEYGLYLLAFLLPVQTRWIIKIGETEYATHSLYGTDMLLILVLLLFIVYGTVAVCRIRPKFPNFGKFLSKIFSPILLYCFKNFIKNFLEIMKIYDRKSMRRQSLYRISNFEFNSKFKIQNLLIFGLFLASFVSVFFAIDKMLALYKLGWLILGLGLFGLIVSVNYNRLKLICAMLAGVFLQAVLGSWQFLTQSSLANKWLGLALHNGADLGVSVVEAIGADGVGERWLRAYGGLDHPNILGGITAIGLLILVREIIKLDKLAISNRQLAISKIIIWLLLVILTAGLFFSFSRAAWLALLIGLALMLAGAAIKKNLPAQKNILQVILIFGLVFFILFFQFPHLIMARLYPVKLLASQNFFGRQNIFHGDSNDEVVFNGVSGGERLEIKSNNERAASIKNSLLIIKKNWAAGTGIGNYTLALNRQRPGQKSFYYQPAHNVFMLVWAETGVVGLLFFAALLLAAATSVSSAEPSGRNDNKAAILIALVALLSFDHWFWSLHFGVLFFWLILGVIAGGERAKN